MATGPPAPPGLEVERISRWIQGVDGGLLPPFGFARMGDGQSNLTYLVTDRAGGRRVLRRPPLGPLLPSAHDVAREHRVMSALVGTAVPVPVPLALSVDGSVCDAPLMLMTLVDGLVLDSVETAGPVPPERRHTLGLSVASTLGAIHSVDLAATGLDTLASHRPYAERQLKRWRQQWHNTGLRELPRVDAFADRLQRCTPPQHEVTLLHGDYHLSNVVVDPGTGAVAAVLDWELCTLGDPVADLGGMLAYWSEAGEEQGSPSEVPAMPGFPRRADMIERYADSTGRDVASVGFWFALGCWKIAVIGEGVRSRVLRDPRNRSRSARLSEQVVDDMLDRAERGADEYGLPA